MRIDRSERQRPRSSWSARLFVLLLLVAVAAAGVYGWLRFGEQLFRTEVKVVAVEVRVPGVADSVLAAQGYLKSEKQAAIGAKVPGRILEVNVKEGDHVKKDQVLAVLEHRELDRSLKAMEASLKAMEASLEVSKSEVAEVETTLAQDERDLARVEGLYRNKGVSAAEHERAQSKVKTTRSRRDSLQAAVRLAEARIQEAEARRAEMEEQIQNMMVKAPFDGVVISKEAEEGESIMPGGMGAASGRGSVVTLANLFKLEVETDVKEDYVSRVRPDQEASVAVDAVPGRRFKGRVRTIIPMGDRARGTVKVKVKLDEDEVREVNSKEPPTLFPEMAATVHFLNIGKKAEGGDVQPQVYAPTAAIVKDENGTFVWQVVSERVKRVSVETGDTRDGRRPAVPDADRTGAEPDEHREGRVRIQRGLKGGEQVVVDPPTSLKEDMLVRAAP